MILLVNLKSALTYEEIKLYEANIRNLDIIVFPSLIYLQLFQNGKYILGTQEISEYTSNDKTGEIVAKQLNSLNVKYALIGHRDRRVYKKENINKLLLKIQNCWGNNITPIYCISENNIKNKCELKKIFNINKKNDILFIYEPYGNIGIDNPKIEQIDVEAKKIKQYIQKKYNRNIKLICGGGISLKNIDKIKNFKNFDGVIISHAAFDTKELEQIYLKLKEI